MGGGGCHWFTTRCRLAVYSSNSSSIATPSLLRPSPSNSLGRTGCWVRAHSNIIDFSREWCFLCWGFGLRWVGWGWYQPWCGLSSVIPRYQRYLSASFSSLSQSYRLRVRPTLGQTSPRARQRCNHLWRSSGDIFTPSE